MLEATGDQPARLPTGKHASQSARLDAGDGEKVLALINSSASCKEHAEISSGVNIR